MTFTMAPLAKTASLLTSDYKGAVHPDYLDEINQLVFTDGLSAPKTRELINNKYQERYSLHSIRTAIRAIKKQRALALDDEFVEDVQKNVKVSLQRVEDNYTRFDKLVQDAIDSQDIELANKLATNLIKIMAIQVDLFKSTREHNAKTATPEVTEDALDELREDVIRRLNLRNRNI
jgi:FKBP-type peptidyl-prolyl cis-trans isomerase (trigger factor)